MSRTGKKEGEEKGERTPFSSPAPQRCQNYHIVCGSAGERSCSAERLLLSHTGGRGEREAQEERQESGVEKGNWDEQVKKAIKEEWEMLTLGRKGTRRRGWRRKTQTGNKDGSKGNWDKSSRKKKDEWMGRNNAKENKLHWHYTCSITNVLDFAIICLVVTFFFLMSQLQLTIKSHNNLRS